MTTQNDWEDEIKDMLCGAGLKPIHFKLNNSGVRIINRIKKELADARREGYEEGRNDGVAFVLKHNIDMQKLKRVLATLKEETL